MTPDLLFNLRAFAPETILLGTLILLFGIDCLFPKTRENYVPLIIIVLACAVCGFATYRTSDPELYKPFFSGLVVNDSFTAFFRYIFFFACAVGAYLAFGTKELAKKSRMEFSLLLLCVTFGMCTMAMSTHLLSLYIAIETVSIVSFVLAGFSRDDLKSNEASLKYLIFGALASGAMVYGFSLVYGYTGSLQYAGIAKYFAENAGSPTLVMNFALVLIYAGLAYKISAFPMHFWTPDVYEGSPTPVATFFSVGPKAAGFAALIRFTKDILLVPGTEGQWTVLANHQRLVPAIAVVSALTMIVGNLSALGQTSVKRILAYSSIAHVGYMLMGLLTLNQLGISAILFYIMVYCGMNIGAFWVVSIVADLRNSDELDAFRGLGWRMPVLGVCMAIFLFSLTGIPLFAGFVGKFLIFTAVLKTPGFLWLALLGVLNSVVSLYYYVKILKSMWLDKPEESLELPRLNVYHAVGLVGLAIPTIVFGLFWAPLLRFATASLATIL